MLLAIRLFNQIVDGVMWSTLGRRLQGNAFWNMDGIGIGVEDYGKDEQYGGQQQELAETSIDSGSRQHDGAVTLPLTRKDVVMCSCRLIRLAPEEMR